MKIDDPGFQDFRRDASCLIRPQSLIGEKFVDCHPTLPRAPGSKPPPPLEKIPAGQPGAGQYLLPLENNSTSVDPDLINNIQQLALRAALPPDPQRTRRRLRRPRRRHRRSGEARQPGPARHRSPLRRSLGPARPARPARRRLRTDPRPAVAPALERRRLLHQRRRRRPGQLRTRRRAGSLAAQVPHLPARVPADDAQPRRLLQRRRAGLLRPRQGDAVADRARPVP